MRLNSLQLRYFLAIGELGALSYAAQKLNVAQSALSHHLAEMEARLQTKLVERHPRGIRLTAAGERLLIHARAIVSAMAKAEEDVTTFSEEAVGPLSVGMAFTAIRVAALPLMRAVREECPRVVLGLVEALSQPLTQKVLDEELDLALVYNPKEDPRLRITELIEEDMFVIGHRRFLSEDKSPIDFEQVIELPLILPHPSVASRAVIDNYNIRCQLPSHTMEIASLSAIIEALIAGIGCSVLARATVNDELQADHLVARRIANPNLKRRLCLVSLRGRAETRSFEQISEILKRIVIAEVQSGRWEARPIEELNEASSLSGA